MIYAIVLIAHSWLRWIVLALGLALLAVATRGWRGGAVEWRESAERLRRGFLAALDTQLVLGIVLYALLSPLSRVGLADLGAAMGNPVLRFYSIEHVVGMLVAIGVAHAGSARATRAEGTRRYRTLVTTQAIWLLITLGSIPWPGLAYGRALLRGP